MVLSLFRKIVLWVALCLLPATAYSQTYPSPFYAGVNLYGSSPSIAAQGPASNINVNLVPKGTGYVNIGGYGLQTTALTLVGASGCAKFSSAIMGSTGVPCVSLSATNTWSQPQTFSQTVLVGGGTPLGLGGAPPTTLSSIFAPSSSRSTADPVIDIERTTSYSGGSTYNPTAYFSTNASFNAAGAWADGVTSILQVTANSVASGTRPYGEAVRGVCYLASGIANTTGCWGGVFIASANGNTTSNVLFGVEGEVDPAVVAPLPSAETGTSASNSFTATSSTQGTPYTAGAGFATNAWNRGSFQSGFECQKEQNGTPGSIIKYGCFVGNVTAPYGLDLHLGTWTSLAINATGFTVDGSGNTIIGGTLTNAALPGLSTSVQGTGLPGLDGGSLFIYQAPATTAAAVQNDLRLQRSAAYTNNYAITAASGNGTTATFSYTGPAITIGDTISVTGEQPFGYNGSCVVTASVVGTPSTVSCANTTTGSQTVGGNFYDVTSIGDVNSLFMLSYTQPNASFYEWPLLSSIFDYTGQTLGNNAQQVAVDGTAFKQYKAGYNYSTAAFAGTIAATTLTVTSLTSGQLSPANRLSGGTASPGTYIVGQLTSTEAGGALGGRGTYQVFPSQTATGVTTATDVIGYATGANFVCEDDTGISNPGGPCVGTEIDNYWVTGSGADNNNERVVLQLVWGGLGAGVSTNDHIGSVILFGGGDNSVNDNALLFGGSGSYGNIINTDNATVTGNIIESPNYTLDGSGNVVSYGTQSIGNTGTYALVVNGGTWFSSFSVNVPIAISALPACASAYGGAHATVNNGVAPSAYKTVVSTTGTDTWNVSCRSSGGTYHWYYD